MATLKRQNASGEWEFIHVTGENVQTLAHQLLLLEDKVNSQPTVDVSLLHTHTNQDVLNKLAEDIDGSLLFEANTLLTDAHLVVQSTQPVGIEEGRIWVDPSDNHPNQIDTDTLLYVLEQLPKLQAVIGDITTLKFGTKTTVVNGLNELATEVESLKQSVVNGKTLLATAISDKGIPTSGGDTFQTMATNIQSIKAGGGSDESQVFLLEELQEVLSNEWIYFGTKAMNGLAIDTKGNSYVASTDKMVHKLSPKGELVWSFTGHTAQVNCVAVDGIGNIYSGDNNYMVKKADRNGNPVWSHKNHSSFVNAVAVDKDGNVISGGNDKRVVKVDKDGTLVWSIMPHTTYIKGVAVDKDGNVYTVSSDKSLRKFSPDGVELWSFIGIPDALVTVDVDDEGNVFGGTAVTYKRVFKLSPNGELLWHTSHSKMMTSVFADGKGGVYSSSGDGTVKKTDKNGNLEWTYTSEVYPTYNPVSLKVDAHGTLYYAGSGWNVNKVSVQGYKKKPKA